MRISPASPHTPLYSSKTPLDGLISLAIHAKSFRELGALEASMMWSPGKQALSHREVSQEVRRIWQSYPSGQCQNASLIPGCKFEKWLFTWIGEQWRGVPSFSVYEWGEGTGARHHLEKVVIDLKMNLRTDKSRSLDLNIHSPTVRDSPWEATVGSRGSQTLTSSKVQRAEGLSQ